MPPPATLAPQPPPAPPEKLTDLVAGQDVYVATFTDEVDGIKFSCGGHLASFISAYRSTSPKNPGEIRARVYWNGTRDYPLNSLRDPRRKSVMIGGGTAVQDESMASHTKKGDVMIECIGVPGKRCDKTRMVHSADKHLVKRCRDCQKDFGKIATKARMKLRRAEGKAVSATKTQKKEIGRPSIGIPGKKNKNAPKGKTKIRDS